MTKWIFLTMGDDHIPLVVDTFDTRLEAANAMHKVADKWVAFGDGEITADRKKVIRGRALISYVILTHANERHTWRLSIAPIHAPA